MPSPRNQCLFCRSNGPFTRKEHPIPESLGNDDLVLPPGIVCDQCNQYFGLKVEQPALAATPFSASRLACSVRSKKGRLPFIADGNKFTFHATGIQDVVYMTGSSDWLERAMSGEVIPLPERQGEPYFVCRLLVKMGLELSALGTEVDPYQPAFDEARQFARSPRVGQSWSLAFGRYPRRDELVRDHFVRAGEPWVREQLYEYALGCMADGDLMFSYIYRDFYFAINLSRPDCSAHVSAFNILNDFTIHTLNCTNNGA